MRRKRLFSIVIVMLFLSVFVCRYVAYAAGNNQGAGGGSSDSSSGGAISCNPMPNGWSTCKGSSWFYIPWDDSWSSYHEDGAGSSTHAFTIEGDVASFCKAQGGFFKYTLVNHPSNTAVRGAIPIYHGAGSSFNSKKIGGTMPYLGDSGIGIPWETVESAYNTAVATYGSVPGTDGFGGTSKTSWFCASYGDNGPCTPGDPNCPNPCTPGDPDCPETSSSCPDIPTPSNFSSSTSTNGYSSVRTQVRNGYSSWSNDVYAKPYDNVQWRHCYFPGAQKVANSGVTYKHDHPSTVKNYPTVNNSVPAEINRKFFASVYNTAFVNVANWGNDYAIRLYDGSTETHSQNVGSTDVGRRDHSSTVEPGWVGNEIYEESRLNSEPWHAYINRSNSDTWTCKYRTLCTGKKSVPAHKTGTKVVCGDERSNTSPDPNGNCPGGVSKNEIPIYTTNCLTSSSLAAQTGAAYCETSITKEVTEECDKDTTCWHAGSVVGPYAFGNANDADGSLSYGKFDKTTSLSSERANVKVPFNFNMSGTISLDGDVVYAGESAKLKTGSVTVEDRWNATTNGTYATRVEGVKVQVLTFVWGSPVTNVPGGANVRYGKIFEIGNMSANETKTLGQLGGDKESVNVDDETAGKYFCVAIQVSPASSGSDTTMSSNGFDKSYRRSGADCKPIAKRPSFQVWGNGVFSNGNIVSGRAVKNNLYGFAAERPYLVSGVSDGNVFGSWAEHSVMALGTISGFGSGASLSGNKTLGSYMKYGLFESTPNSTGYCLNEIPQTFANFTQKSAIQICNSTATQGNAGQFATSPVVTDRTSYIESLVGKAHENVSNKNITSMQLGVGDTWDTITSETGKVVFYTKVGGNLTIDASTLVRGRTYVIHSTNGDITINGNINSQNDGYNSINDIPKLLIFANNIKINCGVTNIDGALIAKNKVDTCANSAGNNYNDAARSNQLVINGTVITNSMDMKRTYGAGVGSTSSVPAEIVNYDTTLILWARSKADTGDSGALNTTYTRELAPRY